MWRDKAVLVVFDGDSATKGSDTSLEELLGRPDFQEFIREMDKVESFSIYS